MMDGKKMTWDQRMVEWAKGKGLLAMLGVASLLIVRVLVLCVIAIVVIPILWIKQKLI